MPNKKILSAILVTVIALASAGGYGVYRYLDEQNRIAERTTEADQACGATRDAANAFLAERDKFVAENLVPIFGTSLADQPQSSGLIEDAEAILLLVEDREALIDTSPIKKFVDQYSAAKDAVFDTYAKLTADDSCPSVQDYLDEDTYTSAKNAVSSRLADIDAEKNLMFGAEAVFLASEHTLQINLTNAQEILSAAIHESAKTAPDAARAFLSTVNSASQDEHDAIIASAQKITESLHTDPIGALTAYLSAATQAETTHAAVLAEIEANRIVTNRGGGGSSSGGSTGSSGGSGGSGGGGSSSGGSTGSSGGGSTGGGSTGGGVVTGGSGAATSTIFSGINAMRAETGLGALSRHSSLDAVAQAWAEQMASGSVSFQHNPNFSNQIPSGWLGAGENIAWNTSGSPEAMNTSWRNSPGHYQNIIGDYTHAGVGWALSPDGKYYGVQVFANY